MTSVVEEPGSIVVVREPAAPNVIEVSSPGPMGPPGSNAWSEITDRPTTLTGYGITDGAPLSHVGAGGTAHANAVAGGAAGFMTGADKMKLDGVATGATANSTDAQLRDRATHTGTQLANTISNFAATVLATVLTGLSLATGTAITAADTVLSALGKLQKQITDLIASRGNITSTPYTTTGTATAFAITPTPAITVYAAGQSHFVAFDQAPGAAPTLEISGIATPPNLVKQNPDGSYSNIAANDFPANHRSRVTLLSASQAWVESMPTSRILLIAAQATTSGASIDFTAIPSWAKEIDVLFNGGSTNGTSNRLIQIGTSGGLQTASYSSVSTYLGSLTGAVPGTTGFIIYSDQAIQIQSGSLKLNLQDASTGTWAISGALAQTNNNFTIHSAGVKTLSGTLDRLRLTTVGGVDTFDLGSVSILIKG